MQKKESLATKTISGIIWMSFGKGSQAILQFVVLIVLARLLSPYDFGIMNAALVIISFASIFSMIGVGPAIIQRSNLNEFHIRTGFTITIIIGALFTIMMYIFSSFIAKFFNMQELSVVLKVLSSVFIIHGFGVVAESLIQRNLKFKLYVRITIVSYLIYAVIGIIHSLLGFNYWSLVIAYLSQSLAQTILLILTQRHNMKILIHWRSLKELFYFGGGFTLARISNEIALQADNLVVGKGLGAESLGLYSRAYQLMIMPANLFGQVIDKVLFPAMSQIQSNQDKLTFSFRMGLAAVSLLTIPTSVFLFIFSKEIVLILFGEKWLELSPILQVLSLGLLFRTGYKISDSVAKATGAVYKRAWRQIIYATAVFAGSLIGLKWGLIGVSYGVLVAIIINYLLMTNLSLQYINISILEIIKIHIPALIISIIAFLTIYGVKILANFLALSNLLIMIISCILFVLVILIIVKVNGKRLLGYEIHWLLSLIFSKFNKNNI